MTTEKTRRAGSARSQQGFSLIEVILATLLMGYAVSSLEALFMAGQHKAVLNSTPLTARLLANEIRLLAQLLPKAPSGSVGVTDPEDVLALDSLRGAEFSPPILANLTEFEEMDDWTQSVSVSVASLANPDGTKSVVPDSGLAEQSAKLYEVTVTISYQEEAVKTWSWWIRP